MFPFFYVVIVSACKNKKNVQYTKHFKWKFVLRTEHLYDKLTYKRKNVLYAEQFYVKYVQYVEHLLYYHKAHTRHEVA